MLVRRRSPDPALRPTVGLQVTRNGRGLGDRRSKRTSGSRNPARTSASVERYLRAFRFTGHGRLFSRHSPCATQAAVSREQRHGTTWESARPTNAKADLNRAGLWPRLSAKVHRVRWLLAVEAGFLPLRSFHDRQVLDPEDTDLRFPTSSAVSGLNRSRQARRNRRVRPLLDLLEDRCMLSFGSPSLFGYGTGAGNAAVAIGDVYGYGIPDIVTATTSGSLSISQGKGDGTFLTPVMVSIIPPADTPLPTSFSAVKLVDLDGRINPNGTPILDIVAADPAQDELWVLMNDGHGAFSSEMHPTTVVHLPSGSDPVAMAVAGATPDFIDSSTIDFNGDTTTNLLGNTAGNTAGNNAGHLKYAADIVIANAAGNNVIVLLGNGDGTFKTPSVPYPVGNDPVAVALGDFNNDGFPDIITANKEGNSVSVLLNNGVGGFSAARELRCRVR